MAGERVTTPPVTGKVTAVFQRANTNEVSRLTIDVNPGPLRFKNGDTVEVHKVLTDEDIGHRLRRMLTESGALSVADLRRSVRSLADEVENEYGWPIMADLIREVGGVEKR